MQFDSSVRCRDCFVGLPPRLCRDLLEETFLTLRVRTRDGREVFVGWTGGQSGRNGALAVPLKFAQGLGLSASERVVVEAVEKPAVTSRVVVSSSKEDWDVILLQAERLEGIILEQLKVVFPGMKFPIVLNDGAKIYLNVDDIEGDGECFLLGPGSEIAIAPPQCSKEEEEKRRTATEVMKREPASLRARTLSNGLDPHVVEVSEPLAKNNKFQDRDLVLIYAVDSATGRRKTESGLVVTLRIRTDLPPGKHVRLHDFTRAFLGSPYLSIVSITLVDTPAVQVSLPAPPHKPIRRPRNPTTITPSQQNTHIAFSPPPTQ